MGVQIDEIDCPEFRINSGLTQKNLHTGLVQEVPTGRCSRDVTKNSDCDMFDWQGMKPLHTSMIVKRLQLTFSVSGSHPE